MAMWQFPDVTINIDNLGGNVNMAESLKWYHEAHGQNKTHGDPHQVNNEGDAAHDHECHAGDDATPWGPDCLNALLTVLQKILCKGNCMMQIKHDHHKTGSCQRSGLRGGEK